MVLSNTPWIRHIIQGFQIIPNGLLKIFDCPFCNVWGFPCRAVKLCLVINKLVRIPRALQLSDTALNRRYIPLALTTPYRKSVPERGI
ncbi:hypothetical protein TNCV_3852431 [Trichonephila clavipes]|nr:hypothetical protein TNCV_3852431 [Trichonephila clavipes]